MRLYDRLFTNPTPGDEADKGDWRTSLNPASLEVRTCPVEPTLASARPGETFQFERLGYFCVDKDAQPGRLVFNRSVTLKDTWARITQRTNL